MAFFETYDKQEDWKNMKKHLHKLLSAGIAAAMLFSTLTVFPGTVSAEGTMKADDITEGMTIGWNIGNSLDANGGGLSQETSWGNPVITQELIDAVKAKGFNTIRVPTTWYKNVTQSTDASGNPVYTINPDWLARVKEVVDYAYNQGMYVILNLHHEEWINRSDFPTAYDEMSPRLIQMWEQIAAYFKDYDQHLIFEGMNEPRQTGVLYEWQGNADCYAVVNKLNADFVNTVRSIDSPYKDTRLLMIPSYAASAYASSYSSLEIPDDDYVAVSLHAYTPYNFAMGDGDHTVFSDNYKSDLDSLFSDIQYYFTDKDVPVVLGEFSASNFDNTDARCDWATYYLTWTKKLGIPCVLWDNNAITNSLSASEAHGYLNRSNNTWYEASEPVVDAMMAVIDDNGVAWGSEKHLPIYEHADLSTGDVIWEGENSITEASSAVPITKDQLTKGEIAVVYTSGSKPVIAFMDSSWGNWTEVGAYSVDEEKGIAYYSSEDIAKAWGGDISTIGSICVKTTGGECTYTKIVALGESTLTTGTTPMQTTETTTSVSIDYWLLGDVNDDDTVNVADIVYFSKYLLGNAELTKRGHDNADLNGDSKVNGMDLTILRQWMVESNV